jgi:hypothetical protein
MLHSTVSRLITVHKMKPSYSSLLPNHHSLSIFCEGFYGSSHVKWSNKLSLEFVRKEIASAFSIFTPYGADKGLPAPISYILPLPPDQLRLKRCYPTSFECCSRTPVLHELHSCKHGGFDKFFGISASWACIVCCRSSFHTISVFCWSS